MRSPNSLTWIELFRAELELSRQQKEAEQIKTSKCKQQMAIQKRLLLARRSMV